MKNSNVFAYTGGRLKDFARALYNNKVALMFIVLCTFGLCTTGRPVSYTVTEVFTRFSRNTFIVLALIIPVVAGLGLNFGIVVGAMAAQIAIFWTVYWGFTGTTGLLIAIMMSTPIAIFFGWLVGKLYNKTKGAEMITGMILAYFADGLYQFFFLFLIGGVIPVDNPTLIIAHGIGVKNTIDLAGNLKYTLDTISMLTILELACFAFILIALVRIVVHFVKKDEYPVKQGLVRIAAAAVVYGLSYVPFVENFLRTDRLALLDAAMVLTVAVVLWQLFRIVRSKLIDKDASFDMTPPCVTAIAVLVAYALTYIPAVEEAFAGVQIPVMTYLCIAALCLFNTALLNTRLGQNMRTVGQSRTVANAAGINVNRTRVIAMCLSTLLAAWGQIIYLQNIGTFSTYGAHTMCGQYAIAAILVGGASVQQANNKQAILGVILFHTLFVVSPLSASHLFGNSMYGEYFRVFVCYGVIAASLAMHAWKKLPTKKEEDEERGDGDKSYQLAR